MLKQKLLEPKLRHEHSNASDTVEPEHRINYNYVIILGATFIVASS